MTLAVGFDFDRTLGHDHGLERRAFGVFAAELGITIDVTTEPVRGQVDVLLARFRAQHISLDAMIEEFVASLGTALPPHAGERYRECALGLIDGVTAVEGAQAMLDALVRDGIPVAILTNGWSPLQQKKIAHALRFSGPVLVSDRLGVQKPHPQAFDALIAALGVAREHIIYVGDNARGDIGGARAAGMRAIWVDADGEEFPADVEPPTAVVHDLLEVEPLIRGTLVTSAKKFAQPDGNITTHRRGAP